MTTEPNGGKPTPVEKRRVYALFFVVALAIDLLVGVLRHGAYTPTLIGSAIMITAVLFFVYSLIRER